MLKIDKDLRRLGIVSISALMLLGVGAGAVSTTSTPVHAMSQAELAKIFASKDPDKASAEFADKHGAKSGHDIKLSPTEQKQQNQELAAAEKQGQKAAIMQEEEGAHVNAPQAKILNAGSMALSKANGKLADKLNKALQHNDYKLIKRLTAKVNAKSNQATLNNGRRALHSHSPKVVNKAKNNDATRIHKSHEQVKVSGKSTKLARQINQLRTQLKRISQHIRALL